MPARSPEERALVARIAAAERWGRTPDRSAATAPARNGLRAKFEREADPESRLDPAERAYRADQLMRAHMARMSLRAKTGRRKAREARDAAAVLDQVADEAERALSNEDGGTAA